MSMRKLMIYIASIMMFSPMISRANTNVIDSDNAELVVQQYKFNSNDSDLNYSFFDINVDESGSYFAEFWLMPAKYPDGTYTIFSIYVNDKFIGNINPDKGNWQACRIDGCEKIDLHRGQNSIKVGVPSPEIPNIETIKLARNSNEAKISSSAYESFCNIANASVSYDIPKGNQISSFSSTDLQSNNVTEYAIKHFEDVPLMYTFYIKFSFQEGEIIEVSSSSLSEHDIDILYFSNNLDANSWTMDFEHNQDSEYSVTNNSFPNEAIGFNPNFGNLKYKFNESIYLASSDLLQGLNWKGISIKDPNDNINKISKTVKIPKTGSYLIRLRHRESGKTGIANFSLNGKYTYQNVPISFSWVPCEIPANGKEYGTMTFCKTHGKDDPILFIHGADADRIVGFRDDAPSDMQIIHGLSKYDSHVLQEYKIKTSGISVCNYSSSDPVSTCDIISGVDESLFEMDPEFNMKPKKNYDDDLIYPMTAFNYVTISGSLHQSDVLSVKASSEIHNITISDLSGNIIKSIKEQGKDIIIPRELLNISQSGIYVVTIETDKGIVAKKMVVE